MADAAHEEDCMRIEKTIVGVRSFVQAARREGKDVGLVPTMGAFHEGHLALISRSCQDNETTIVSLFVNPTQFSANEDYGSYPRSFERDALLAEEAGVSLVFAPGVEEIYGESFTTWVEVLELTERLCGARRPGHFRGVTTVVTKLLNICQPNRAYFGEKDYQQLQVIRRMVRDLNSPVEIVSVPTVREADGLAMSSRNLYLAPQERLAAPQVYRALSAGAAAARQGASGDQAVAEVLQMLGEEPLIRPDYVRAVDPETLEDRGEARLPMVLAAAVYLGETRLIDNIKVEE